MEQKQYPKKLFLEDGTEVRLVPIERTGRPLYMSKDGRGFSYCHGRLRLIKHQLKIPSVGSKREYFEFRWYNDILVSHAVLSAWVCPRPEGMECDHINGNHLDNRLENLEWVTPAENTRRRWELNASKGLSYCGKKITELGKVALRQRGTKRKQWKLVQLTINFND